MKIGIIDAGGGMRGIYTAGIYDYCMEHGILFDLCIGISAGSGNQACFLASQPGRNYRSYTKFAFRKEYMGWGQWLRTGSFVNLDYIYSTLSNSGGEDPLDYPAFAASPMDFLVVATDAVTGAPAYFPKSAMTQDDYGIIKCSCCVPVFNKPYPYQGGEYLDGGISDPIPLKKAFALGCDKVILLLTRPRDFRRQAKNDIRLSRFLRKKYPAAAKDLAERSRIYNEGLTEALQYEAEGKLLLLAPKDIFGMETLTRDREKMDLLYRLGVKDAEAIPGFIESSSL